MRDDEGGCTMLKDPLSISDLLGSGTKFEMNTNFDDIHDMYDEVYGSDGEDDVEIDEKALVSPWTKPFSELKEQMVAIKEGIYKKIVKPGDAEKGLMAEKSRVCVRYNAYWEGEGAPFDSTFLRGSAFNFYTGRSSVLPGLEEAVRTMHQGEEAQFIISYHLLFGEMGCPPRIKQRADGLFIIELVSFNAVGDLNAAESLSAEDCKKFSVVVKRVEQLRLKSRDFFQQEMHKNCCRASADAVSLLNLCHLENEEEEREQTAILVNLYTNLAVCYNKMRLPNKTCLMCREIRRLTNNQPSCKAIFQEGRALLMLGEYQKSQVLLKRAQHMEPQNVLINNELKTLEDRWKSYKENEKEIWRRAMGVKNEPKKATENNECSEFKESMREVLEDFQKCTIKNDMKLAPGLTKQEIETMNELAEQFQMQLEFSPLTKTHSIRKK